jgi:hypothetical protein
MFRIDRVDYIADGLRCEFCKRELNSRIAYILRDQSGKEHISGPTCLSTRAKIDRNKAVFPDFTKTAIESPDDSAKGGAAPAKARTKKEGLEELEYLVLRYRKLTEFPAMRLKSLDAVWDRYVKGQFSDDDRKHLAALIRKVRAERPEYSPENLTACYAYSLWIKEALKQLNPDKHQFLQKMLMQIFRKMYLSPAQANAVNKWLSRIPGVPTLDPCAFNQLLSPAHDAAV